MCKKSYEVSWVTWAKAILTASRVKSSVLEEVKTWMFRNRRAVKEPHLTPELVEYKDILKLRKRKRVFLLSIPSTSILFFFHRFAWVKSEQHTSASEVGLGPSQGLSWMIFLGRLPVPILRIIWDWKQIHVGSYSLHPNSERSQTRRQTMRQIFTAYWWSKSFVAEISIASQ